MASPFELCYFNKKAVIGGAKNERQRDGNAGGAADHLRISLNFL